MRQQPAGRQGSLRVMLWCVYDGLWIALAGVIYGVAALVGGALLHAAYAFGGWVFLAFALLPSYIVFLLVVVVQMAAIRLASPRIEPGIYRKFSKGNFFALVWLTGLNNVLFAMPFMRTVNFIAVLRYLYYRGQGMRTHFGNWISVDAVIMDPSLVSLGRNVNIGGMAAITSHVATHDMMVILPVTIGNEVVIGAACKIGPGVEIGDHALVGAEAALGIRVKIGEGAYVEPFSRVESNTVIAPYERWGGVPAVHLGMRPRRQEEAFPQSPDGPTAAVAPDEGGDVPGS